MTLPFPELLRLIDDRAAAFRAAVAAAPRLDAQVPTCPEWTVLDLAQHIGQSHRRWALTVAAGPADEPPPFTAPSAPADPAALQSWLAEGTSALLTALRTAGPSLGCWTWWGPSESPQTSGAVARHQLQHIAIHTYDAQLTTGSAHPLAPEIALDGVDEFLSTCVATTAPWPHKPATIDYHATEGPSWRVTLTPEGARITPGGADATASARGTAHDLVMFFYGRVAADSLETAGDPTVFDQIIAWEPEI